MTKPTYDKYIILECWDLKKGYYYELYEKIFGWWSLKFKKWKFVHRTYPLKDGGLHHEWVDRFKCDIVAKLPTEVY